MIVCEVAVHSTGCVHARESYIYAASDSADETAWSYLSVISPYTNNL